MKYIVLVILLVSFTLLNCEVERSRYFYPILDYSDETNLSGGGVMVYLYRQDDQARNVPPGLLKLKLEVGVSGNWSFDCENEWQFEKGKYAINLPLSFEIQDCKLYGINDDINLEVYNENRSRQFYFNFQMLRRWEKYDFGFTFTGNYFKYNDPIDIKWLISKTDTVYAGGRSLGPGLTFQYNTLDNQYFPLKGLKVGFDLQTFSEALSSDYTYECYSLETVCFIKLARLTTWGTKLNFIVSAGDTPYQELPSLGNKLRIFKGGQFSDKYLMSLITEIRSFPWDTGKLMRWGVVVFAEAGQVKADYDDFRLKDFVYGAGIGIRYLLDIDELFTIRLDGGLFKDQISIDFSSREAF